jgi:hypothetical protein
MLLACDRALARARKKPPNASFDSNGAFSRDSASVWMNIGGYIRPGRINEITKWL